MSCSRSSDHFQRTSDYDFEKQGRESTQLDKVPTLLRVPEGDPNIVTWDSETDPSNPLNFSNGRKWTLLILGSIMGLCSGLASATFSPNVDDIMEEFGVTSSSIGTLITTVFVLGLATGPLFLSPISELYGRRILQDVGSLGFLLFTIGCGLSKNVETLIIMRLLQGAFVAAPSLNGGPLVADIMRQEERGRAISVYGFGLIVGVFMGPVLGPFLAAAGGWRWCFWFVAILTGATLIPTVALWKETYAPVILSKKAAALRKETGNTSLHTQYDTGRSPGAQISRATGRVFKMLMYSPVQLALGVYTGILYAFLYVLFTSQSKVFLEVYHFKPSLVGLTFLGNGVGFMAAQIGFGIVSDPILVRLAKRHGKGMKPEYRLPICCIVGITCPVGLFWYGWSAQAGVHWMIPMIGVVIVSFSAMTCVFSIQSYLVDAFTLYAASATGANVLVRSIICTCLPLAVPKMHETLGYGWTNSVLAFMAVATLPIPCLIMVYGERMRGWNVKRMNNI